MVDRLERASITSSGRAACLVPRIGHLRKVPAACKVLSIEPLLEDLGELDLAGIGWVLVGSSRRRRAMPDGSQAIVIPCQLDYGDHDLIWISSSLRNQERCSLTEVYWCRRCGAVLQRTAPSYLHHYDGRISWRVIGNATAAKAPPPCAAPRGANT